ncbi:unnamed protein product [Urochloa humidicola]
MDAISCVGVAPQSALLSRSFADAAIARALHFSLSSSDDVPEPSATAPPATITMVPTMMHGFESHYNPPAGGGGASPSPSPAARCRLGPAGGHAGKRRRPRPSKRAPTTYISTDASTFRAMVQRVTGADDDEAAAGGLPLLQQHQQDGLGLGLLLPHLGVGVEQFLHAGPAAAAAYAATMASPAAAAAEQQQPLFPTLDSWNVMYGKKNEAA